MTKKKNINNKSCGNPEPIKIPPFRQITGNKYKYPKNEKEWNKECKKAITYQKKRWKAICENRSNSSINIPKRNYYYENLLTKPVQHHKRRVRNEHRTQLKKDGKIPEKNSHMYHVHHKNGKYDNIKDTEVMHIKKHKHVHKDDIKKKRKKVYKNN